MTLTFSYPSSKTLQIQREKQNIQNCPRKSWAKLILASVVSASVFSFAAYAEDGSLHPKLGKKSLAEISNSDVLSLSTKEQASWVHGYITALVTATATDKPKVSRCLSDWAFDVGNGLEVLPAYMRHYSDAPAYSTVYAVAQQACPDL